MTHSDMPTPQAEELTGNNFRASLNAGLVVYPELNIDVHFENGPKAEGGVEEEVEWFKVARRELLELLRRDTDRLGPGAFGFSTPGFEERESVTLLSGDLEAVSSDFWRDLAGGDVDWRLPVRAVTHALAHGLQDAARIEAFLLDVLGDLDTVDEGLALDFLRAIQHFWADEFKLELLEALALRLGELPPGLEGAFELAVGSVRGAEEREQAAQVFEPDYDSSLRPGLQPFWFAIGTLNKVEFADGGAGWFMAMGATGRVDRRGSQLEINNPNGVEIHDSVLESDYTRTSFTSPFASATRSGIYTLQATYAGHVYEIEVNVDGTVLLPIAENVRVTNSEDGPLIEWDSVPGASHYEVEIATGGTTFQIYRVDEPHLDLAALPRKMAPGSYSVQAIRAFSRRPDCGACAVYVSQYDDGPTFQVPASDTARQEDPAATDGAAEAGPTTLWLTLVAYQLSLDAEAAGLDRLGEFEVLRVEQRDGELIREALVRPGAAGAAVDIDYRENDRTVPLDGSDRAWLDEAAAEALQRLEWMTRMVGGDGDREWSEAGADVLGLQESESGNGLFGVDERGRYYSVEYRRPNAGPAVLTPEPDPSPSAISRIHHLIAHGLGEPQPGVDAYAAELEAGRYLSRDARAILGRLLADYSPKTRNAWREAIDLERATVAGGVSLAEDYGRLVAIEGDGYVVLDEYRDTKLVSAMVLRGSPLEVTVIEREPQADRKVGDSPYGPLSSRSYRQEELPAELQAWYERVLADTVTNLYRQTPSGSREGMSSAWDMLADGTRVSLEVSKSAAPRIQGGGEQAAMTPVLQLGHQYGHGLMDGEGLSQGLIQHLNSDPTAEEVHEVQFLVEQLYPGYILLRDPVNASEDRPGLATTLTLALQNWRPGNSWRLPGLGGG
jgi:hypothetical protein